MATHNSITDNQLHRVTAHLRSRVPGLRAVYLYGSLAAGEGYPGSDADLAILSTPATTASERFELAAELADILGREVDLIDLEQTTTVLRARVIGLGRRLTGPTDAALEDYEDRALSDYARLNEERAGILADIEERGNVYG